MDSNKYLNTKNFSYNVPFWMYDIDNKQLITSPFIPSDIKDMKGVSLTETDIPGLNFQPVNYGGGKNRHVSFTLPLLKKNNTAGNVLVLKQFENLRNQATGVFGMFSGQFKPNPRVLFSYGVGSVPLVWWVPKCDFTHKQGWVNQMGMPMYSEIEIELILDESHPLYKAEEAFRKFSSLAGMAQGIIDVYNSQHGKRPY